MKIAKQYNADDEAQLLYEVKATGIPVGLLTNFGREKVEFKRLDFEIRDSDLCLDRVRQ